MLAASTWGLTGCHSAGPDPSALLQAIAADFLHGDLEVAQHRAAIARKEFSDSQLRGGASWGLRFGLLEAEILLRQYRPGEALALLSEAGAPDPAQADLVIKRDVLLALAHSRLDQLARAEQELRQARELAESRHSTLMGDVLRAEALLERDAGHLDSAIEKFKTSLAAARKSRDVLLQACDLVDIGFSNMQEDHFDEALVTLQRAVDFSRVVRARRQLQLALGDMGWVYYNLGDFERALVNFQQAEELAKNIGMGIAAVTWLQDTGLAHYKLGALGAAQRDQEEALRAAATLPAGGGTDRVVNIETNLALLLYEQNQYSTAQTHIDAAARGAKNSKSNNVTAYVGFVQGLLAARSTDGPDAAAALLTARQEATDPDLRTDIENALANLHADRHQPADAELWYRRAIHTFEDKRSAEHDEALRLAAFGYGTAVYRDYAEFLIESKRPLEALQLLDQGRARTLEEGLTAAKSEAPATSDKVMSARDVARHLNASVLFYSLGPRKSYLWVITARETRLFVLPNASDIQALVDQYQRAIQRSSDPLQTENPVAASLYTVLLQPAAGMIAAGSKVYVIPDGSLQGLNFETLLEPVAGGFRYWIETVTVVTASSVRMLALSRAPAANSATRDLLLIGNPQAAANGFDALPNAPLEMRNIQQHFPPQSQTVLTGPEAVPTAYATSNPDQFRYIHFVAHGTASRLTPLDSAVVLSAPRGNPEGFKLYARDIVQYPLNATLVTISTCYGSGVRAYAGEGLVGLAWVFLRAGSHNVIAALWQADDASTAILMDRVYTGLQAGKAPDEALRDAKLTLLHSPNVYRKPLYWGAFQLYAGS
jgi:CHAT domain-containing protein